MCLHEFTHLRHGPTHRSHHIIYHEFTHLRHGPNHRSYHIIYNGQQSTIYYVKQWISCDYPFIILMRAYQFDSTPKQYNKIWKKTRW